MPITNEEREYLKFLGENIIKIRKKNNLKQEELSDLLDIDDGSLRRIESGRTNPTTITLLRIANVLKISIKEIFDLKKDI
ncbi:MAG: helix-turn-helix transcriptional regulator [Flavobacteriaceae bacterium]|jgi:transcriptional regulator with XRE-family HTH domain|nr:helix-turn-helix transcriptional regulator [Flavobacteriaceae bacterium]